MNHSTPATAIGTLAATFISPWVEFQPSDGQYSTTVMIRRHIEARIVESLQREVDIVLEDRAGEVVGIEVKASASVRDRSFAGLRDLEEAAGGRFVRGIVLYAGDTVVPFSDRLHAVPFSALWRW